MGQNLNDLNGLFQWFKNLLILKKLLRIKFLQIINIIKQMKTKVRLLISNVRKFKGTII